MGEIIEEIQDIGVATTMTTAVPAEPVDDGFGEPQNLGGEVASDKK